MMGRPVLVLSQNIKRESGRKVQIGNITAAKTIADIIRTCLGPRAMMKMLLDPMGGIVMTNDGNAILREIQVQHPAAKSMIEISRTQDEEVGDGTTSVIILAGEMLSVAEHFLEQQMHPTVVISAYRQALDDMLNILKDISHCLTDDLSQEVERNLQDAMQVCRNVLLDPHLLPGGGAVEMEVSHRLTERSRALTGVEQWPYRTVAQALEVIPRTLIQNCGASAIRVLTSLRAKHTQEGNTSWGINGETGTLAEMEQLGIWEPLAVKAQTYKTAVETAILLLRIDDIVSGHKKKGDDQAGGALMEDKE
uniref:T-complex protein 1 subunit gamma n=1 Tax=Sinocyclocheilus anshuiensis TaxID=1608454 RepID=A0A671L3G2_9TELE